MCFIIGYRNRVRYALESLGWALNTYCDKQGTVCGFMHCMYSMYCIVVSDVEVLCHRILQITVAFLPLSYNKISRFDGNLSKRNPDFYFILEVVFKCSCVSIEKIITVSKISHAFLINLSSILIICRCSHRQINIPNNSINNLHEVYYTNSVKLITAAVIPQSDPRIHPIKVSTVVDI